MVDRGPPPFDPPSPPDSSKCLHDPGNSSWDDISIDLCLPKAVEASPTFPHADIHDHYWMPQSSDGNGNNDATSQSSSSYTAALSAPQQQTVGS